MNWETLSIGPQLQWTQMKKQELKETMTNEKHIRLRISGTLLEKLNEN